MQEQIAQRQMMCIVPKGRLKPREAKAGAVTPGPLAKLPPTALDSGRIRWPRVHSPADFPAALRGLRGARRIANIFLASANKTSLVVADTTRHLIK